MQKLCITILIIFSFKNSFSQNSLQKTWSNWIGYPYGITFKNGIAEEFYTQDPNSSLFYSNTSVAYSDSINGNIQFIATPNAVYDRNYDTVTNGYGLIACGSFDKYAIMIIPFSDGQNKFYIIHQFPSSSVANTMGLQTRCSIYSYITHYNPGYYYSILDMNYNNGKGIITSKNNYLPSGGEQMVQIRHANGKEMWLIGHTGNGNSFSRVLFSQTGIKNLPSKTLYFSSSPAASAFIPYGYIEASSAGNKIAITSKNNKLVNLYNFNNITGEISQYTTISLPDYASELCFSPDGSKLYVSTYNYTSCSGKNKLFQIDLSAANVQQSIFQLHENVYYDTKHIQKVVGNKILFFDHIDYSSSVDYAVYTEIAYPNQPANACTLIKNAFTTRANGVNAPCLPNDIVVQNIEAPIAKFNFPKDTSVCFGNYTITAPLGYAEYRWNTGDTTQSITVSKPGIYHVLAGNTSFSKPSAYGYTNVSRKGQSLNLGTDKTLCPNDNYQINISTTFTNVLWQNGDTSHQIIIKYPGDKLVISAVDANGCRVKDSVCIGFKGDPKAQFGNDTILCAGQHLTLRMEPMEVFSIGAVYKWQDGSKKDSLRVTTSGTYWGSVKYEGCTASDTIKVNFISPVSFNLGKDTTLCNGDSIQLSVNQPNLQYNWNTGSTNQSILVYSPGTYMVSATNGNCTFRDTIIIQYNSLPQFSIGPDKKICPYDSVVLTAPIAGKYVWSNGSTANTLKAKQAGMYWLKITVNGCAWRDTVLVSQKPLPIVKLGKDTTLCNGDNIELNVYNTGASYLWFNGSIDSIYNVTQPVTAFVEVNLNGCVKSDTINIQFKNSPVFTLGNDTTICFGNSIELKPKVQDGSYTWQDGSKSFNFVVKKSGLYSLKIMNQCGSYKDSLMVSQNLCELLMPNAFTPNGDGVNDIFRIKYPQYLKTFVLTIYNRQGNKMYETNTVGNGWDGKYKGQPQPTGTFIWCISYTDLFDKASKQCESVVLIR